MEYPIVQVKTKGNVTLHGLFIEAKNPKAVFIHVHGTGSNFYEEDYIKVMTEKFVGQGISMLSTNNRGTGVYNAYDKTGAATELFEDSVFDIDAWIDFVLKKGYSKVILAGHSLGTEKVVFYMSHGKHQQYVAGIVLLAPADSNWSQRTGKDEQEAREWNERTDHYLSIAKRLVEENKEDVFLARDAYAGVMPKTAHSMINFLDENQEITKGLPLHLRKLKEYSDIELPILAVIGDQHEYTAIPIREALELMKKENPRTQTLQLKNCDHDFTGHEEELTDLVVKFIEGEVVGKRSN